MVSLEMAEKLLALAVDARGNVEERRNAAMLVCRFIQEQGILSLIRRMAEEYDKSHS
jgi:hypothetical protein